MSFTDFLKTLEPIALGELHLRPEQFAGYTMAELEALINGYIRRYQHLEDLFIINCALPAYRAAYGNKAPSYKQLTAHRNMARSGKTPDHLDKETEAYWLAILDGGTSNVKKS